MRSVFNKKVKMYPGTVLDKWFIYLVSPLLTCLQNFLFWHSRTSARNQLYSCSLKGMPWKVAMLPSFQTPAVIIPFNLISYTEKSGDEVIPWYLNKLIWNLIHSILCTTLLHFAVHIFMLITGEVEVLYMQCIFVRQMLILVYSVVRILRVWHIYLKF